MKIPRLKSENGATWWQDEEMTPEEQAALMEETKRTRDRQVMALRSGLNAPQRHMQCNPSREGAWGERLNLLENKLGTGFTIALVGGRGNGKTQLAVELLKTVTGELKPGRFCTATGFFIEIKATFRREATRTEDQVLKEYMRQDLVVIDEVGKRSDSEWENSLLFELLNRRYNDMKDTLLIDNRTKTDFVASIGPSLASRMSEAGGIIECDWESFR